MTSEDRKSDGLSQMCLRERKIPTTKPPPQKKFQSTKTSHSLCHSQFQKLCVSAVSNISAHLFSCRVVALSGFWCFVDHHRARDLERVFSAACVRWVATGTTEVRGSKMRGLGKDFVSRSMLQDKKNSIYSQMPLIITLWPVSVFTFRVLLFLACSSAL